MRRSPLTYLLYLVPVVIVAAILYDIKDIIERGIIGYFSVFHPAFKHLALSATTLLIIYAISKYAITDGDRRARKWIGVLTPGDNNPSLAGTTNAVGTGNSLVIADPADRVVSQLAEIRTRIAHHFEVMVYFYVRYYMSILTFSIAAAMAAITLLFISKQGIDGANQYILNLFIVTTACAAFYGAFPGVFRQEQNITDNKTLYLQYVALEQEVLSFSVTGEDITGTVTTPAKFIHYVDQQLAKFNNIAIGFDHSKVPNFVSVFDERLNSAKRNNAQPGNAGDDNNAKSNVDTVSDTLNRRQQGGQTPGNGSRQQTGATQADGRQTGTVESGSPQQPAKEGGHASSNTPAAAASLSTDAATTGKSPAQK